MVSCPHFTVATSNLHACGAAASRSTPSWDLKFLELNFEQAVADLLPFYTSPRSGITKACMAVLQRDFGQNSLGHNGMADRHKEVQVRVISGSEAWP